MSQVADPPNISVLYSAAQIEARVQELGRAITRTFAGQKLVVLVVLKGSFIFAADLVRAIDLPLRIEFLGLKSYGVDTQSSGVVQITQDLTSSITGENVLVVEDIVDTGLTISYLTRLLEARGPSRVQICSLLHKPARQMAEVSIDFLGFTIPDRFVVGYGLDHAQAFRNLPYLGVIEA